MYADTLPRPSCEAPEARSGTQSVLEDAAARALLERRLERLDRLADLGLELAEELVRQAKGETDIDVAKGDIALAYSRVARAVRQSVALQAKLIEDFQKPAREETQTTANDDDGYRELNISWLPPQTDRKNPVRNILGRVVARETDAPEAIERFRREANEWLLDETLAGDLDRPLSEIVADICRDLGLSPDWTMLAQEAWAREEIQSGRPGEPLRELPRSRGSCREATEGALAGCDGMPPPPFGSPSPASQGRTSDSS